jgi:hypothetical protein
MYELSRVRLASVGPRGARFQDVTIDLSGIGQPIPGQTQLLGPARRRPSPASVLFLENGGGKSVLLKLIFSVMLPGRRQVVGAAGSLESFVLASDCAHVALEWVHVRSGDRVVVGKVLQWRDHAVSNDASRLKECWYSFRPDGELELDSLPIVLDGRLRTLAGFREAMLEARRRNPAVELIWTQVQAEWTTYLESLGLDPELFRYQRAMNADEGEAAEAFHFKTDDEFVAWLLTAVTDPSDPSSLAENFEAYATTVGDRDAMVLERDFVSGALERLRALGDAAAERAAALELGRGVRIEAAQLAETVNARYAADSVSLEELTGEVTAAKEHADAAEAARDRATSVVNEIRRRVVLLEIEAAETDKGVVAAALANAELQIEGWRATGPLLEHGGAVEQVRQLKARVEAAKRNAAPALEARDRAARALLHGLYRATAAATAESGRHEQAAGEHGQRAAMLTKQRIEAANAATAARTLHKERLKLAASVTHELEEAIGASLLSAGTSAGDEAEAAAASATAAAEALADARGRLDRSRREYRYAGQKAGGLEEAERQARNHFDGLAAIQGRLRGEAERLAGDPRTPELLALDRAGAGDVDDHVEELERLLRDAVESTEAQLRVLHREADNDQRVLNALGDGGLLPPRPEVEAALAVLNGPDVGVPAMSGWRYLADAATSAERHRGLLAHPELADGVVLINPDDLGRAEAALIKARLLPGAAVAVGASALLLSVSVDTPASGSDQRFLIPPNPAMFDEEAAVQERLAARARQEERQARILDLEARAGSDRALRARLHTWRRDCPPGRLDQLAAEADAAAERVEQARTEAAAQREAVERLANDVERLEQTELPRLETEAAGARERAERLARLAVREAERAAALRETAALQDQAEGHDAAALRAERDASREDELRGEALRSAEGAQRRAAILAEEAKGVHGGTGLEDGQMSPRALAQAEAPSATLPELRAAYQAADHAYRTVAVGEDLYGALALAERREADARARVEALDTPVRVEAERLLATSAGAEPASRAAASRAAEREAAGLRRRGTELTERLGALRNDLKHNTPTGQNVWIVLPDERSPRDADHGRELLAAAQGEQLAANDALEQARRDQEQLRKRQQQLSDEFRELGNVRKNLAEMLAGVELPALDDAVDPFGGTPEEAERRRVSLRNALTEATSLLRQANEALQAAADALTSFAGAEAYERLQSPARRQILALSRDALAANAAQWVAAMEARLASLEQDLGELERHRKLIVERLAALTGAALGTLRSAQRLSKLAHDLGDWSGQEFLRIRFADPEPGALTVRVAEVVDQAAAEASGRVSAALRDAASKRDSLGLLLGAVRAAVPKGFAVDVLKPDAVLRTERVPVSRMGAVFSGGQLLTAAIALYCTMAALRANERGRQSRARHAGVLFLDNPIGRASAGYLLELQLAVARALGVQLVYTTGLLDLTALSVFPLLVRLRNDADLRAGMRYIAVDEHVRQALPEPYGDDEEPVGTLSAVRLYQRPG